MSREEVSVAKRLSEIEFRLGIELEDYSAEMHADFLVRLAEIGNSTVEEIKTLSKTKGCTILRLRLPDEAARTILRLYHRYVIENCPQDLWPENLRAFIEMYKVENFTRYTSDIEIVIRDKPKGCGIAFVHGWTGDASTFGNWPSFLWNEFGCQSEVFEYPTSVLGHAPSTVPLGVALGEWLRNRFRGKSLALIAHSLGGLVTRRFIVDAQTQDDQLDRMVRNIVFVASPHGGNAIARIAAKIPLLGSRQVDELSNSSPLLSDLNTRWARWAKNNTPGNCRIKCIYGSADKLVTAVDAQGLDTEPIPMLGKGHSDIVKPESESDPIAVSVRRFLLETRFFEDALGSEADRQIMRDVYYNGHPGSPRAGQPPSGGSPPTVGDDRPDKRQRS
jgi:pimeloyl-ACP methyl ester carboxylesterase